MAQPEVTAEDMVYLFFPETEAGRAAGYEHLAKVATRLATGPPSVSEAAAKGPITAIATNASAAFEQVRAELQTIKHPVLYATGMQDAMIPPSPPGSPCSTSTTAPSSSTATPDLRYASREEAIFCQPEVAIGIVPGGGGSDRLARLLGRDRALEAILTSHDYDADRAERYGWVTRAVPDAELDDFVNGVAARIASFDKAAVLGAKAQINRATLPPEADLRASWAVFSESVTWPGFQARVPQLGNAIAEIGLDEIERNLGDYVGLVSRQA
jgi:hypothetical protein